MGQDNAHIKIDQVGIIGAVALCMADSMRIMAGTAGCLKIADVLVMIIKGFVIQNTAPAVTAVA